jgi:chromosome transmission fidelity protein 4
MVFTAFNMVGVIEATDQETHQIINVEFHDKSLHRGYHFQDHHRFHLASLGPRGALYACAPEGDNLAVVNYRPYDTWASSAEWQVSLPMDESAVVVCAGGAPYKKGKDSEDNDDDENDSAGPSDAGGAGHAIVATTSGTIRFWLGTGVQTYVWHIGGEVVAMEAGAEWVFVVHREGGTSLDGMPDHSSLKSWFN